MAEQEFLASFAVEIDETGVLRLQEELSSLFVIRNTDDPRTPDPAAGNLTEFKVLFGNTISAVSS